MKSWKCKSNYKKKIKQKKKIKNNDEKCVYISVSLWFFSY